MLWITYVLYDGNTISMGNTGAKGEKGDGWELKGFVDASSNLPSSGNTLGDLFLVCLH